MISSYVHLWACFDAHFRPSLQVMISGLFIASGSPTRSPGQVASSAEEVSVLTKEDAGKDEQL